MNSRKALDAPLFNDEILEIPTMLRRDRAIENDIEAMHLWAHGTPTVDCIPCNPTGDELAEIGKKKALDNPLFATYRERAEVTIKFLAAGAHEFTADDVTARIGAPPNRYLLGAVFSGKVTDGTIEAVGYVKSTRASSHGRKITSYRGAR